jgi:FKBP-type peptidyl-prolyl cis-trans isomerase SlyD
MNVGPGKVIRIDCELVRAEGGEVIESSRKTGPVEYKHGTGQMLAGLEARLEGLGVGDEKSGVIPAAEAFGTEESQPTMTISRAEFPKDAKVEVGAQFEAKGPLNTPVTLKVISADDEAKTITARVVHPLAGKDVEFRVKVLSIRPPPPPVPKLEDIELEDAPPSEEGMPAAAATAAAATAATSATEASKPAVEEEPAADANKPKD